jgi:hypothetical protein
MTGFRHTIAVDWDGTCVISAWPEQPREWMPGAVEALTDMASYATVLIWSARLNRWDPWTFENFDDATVQKEIDYIRGMLDENGLGHIDIFTLPGKPTASVYIDDKAERYHQRPGSWKAMRDKIRARCGQQDAQFPPTVIERKEKER